VYGVPADGAARVEFHDIETRKIIAEDGVLLAPF
jgi:hypothetical protein